MILKPQDLRIKVLALARDNYESTLVVSGGDKRVATIAKLVQNQSYRFFMPSINGRGQEVRFCWSIEEVDGRFYTWREVVGQHNFKRDRYLVRKKRSQVREVARKRYNAYADKIGGEDV